MKHDYAQALENFNRGSFDYEDRDTILHALRFAEKMMQEPSEGMIGVVDQAIDDFYSTAMDAGSDQCGGAVFIAMRDAALKELGE